MKPQWAWSAKIPVLKSLHWALEQALISTGYTREARRQGELQIGLWRKKWGATNKKGARNPRRFVLIPGFGDRPMSWISVLALLRPAFRRDYDEIVLVDFPGYGGGPVDCRPFHSIELLQTSLFNALDTLKPDTILGHSLGGYLGALYCILCGEGSRPHEQQAGAKSAYFGPRNLILVDPTGIFADRSQRENLEAVYRQAISEAHGGIEHIRPHMFANEPFWFRFLAEEFSAFFRCDEIAQFIDSIAADHNLAGRIRKVHRAGTQVWLVWGEKDTLLPSSCLSAWLSELNAPDPESSFRPAEGVLLKNCGHSPQLEAPTTLAALLSQILAKMNGRTAPLLNLGPAAGRWTLLNEPDQNFRTTT